MKKQPLLPLFDALPHLHKNADWVMLPTENCRTDFNHSLQFLKSYNGSLGTFNSYRREVERLLQWTWLVKKMHLPQLKRAELEAYLHFCQNPPESWIALKKEPRYLAKEGKRVPNPNWRPFVLSTPKAKRMRGEEKTIAEFSMSSGSTSEIFAILSTFFNFLIAEEYLLSNPVALIRQKSKFILKHQHKAPIRRLSVIQWEALYDAALQLALNDPETHERTLFIICILYGMYLRISELVGSQRFIPCMNHFMQDNNGYWWFTTIGKGNKERQIAVSPEMLNSLKRWRVFLGLTPLPSLSDTSPLIPKIRGKGPMMDTSTIRRWVQFCFNIAADNLRKGGKDNEAENLMSATVHWLRHTGISEDVKIRPREHVRDDAGHSSSATTDRYIDIELKARYQSAQKKSIVP